MVIPPYQFITIRGFLKPERAISVAVGDDEHLLGEALEFGILA
jgi:hypothetical protein